MLKSGESYMVVGDTPTKGYEIFNSLAEKMKKGLIVWRVHPDNDADLIKDAVITKMWITNINTKARHLKPQEIEQLCYDIEKYMKTNKSSVVLLTSVDYLISFNSFREVLHLIQNIRDIAAENKVVFIINIGKNTLTEQEEGLLKQELLVVGDDYE